MYKKILSIFLSVSIALFVFTDYRPHENYISAEQSLADIQKQIDDNNKKIADLKKEQEDSKEKSLEAEGYRKIVLDRIDIQNQNIVAIRKQIDALDAAIDEKSRNIAALTVDIANQEALVSNEIEMFKKRLVAMYTSDTSDIAMVLSGASDFIDILSRYELIDSIARYDKEMIDSLSLKLRKLTDDRAILDEEKLGLESDKEKALEKEAEFKGMFDELTLEIADINAELAMLAAIDRDISSEISVAVMEIEDLEEIQAELEAEIKRKAAAAAAALKNKTTGQQIPPEEMYTSGTLAWPCPSSYMISSGYGQRWGKQHQGIDIAAPGGTPIVAAESGYAIIVNNSGWGGGYGLYVVIAHNETLTTLYGHMSATGVSEGEWVSRGQVIGYVGSTGNSTGNHVHFEVRVNGARQDPMIYLK